MALGLTQPLTEMSTRSISWGVKPVGAQGWPPSCAVVMKSGNLNFLEPSRPVQACNGTDLPAFFSYVKNVICWLEYWGESVVALVKVPSCIPLLEILSSARGPKAPPLTHDSFMYCGMCLAPLAIVWKAGAAWYRSQSILLWYVRSLILKNVSVCWIFSSHSYRASWYYQSFIYSPTDALVSI